jgi:hypothetical protein
VAKTPAAAVRGRVGKTPEDTSDKSYKNKEPRFLRAGLFRKSKSARPAYLGADESLLLVDFFVDFLWCFLWVVDLAAGADAEESDAGGVVSAARTGPAASVNRQTTGTSFLNIDRLHCKEKFERLGISVL